MMNHVQHGDPAETQGLLMSYFTDDFFLALGVKNYLTRSEKQAEQRIYQKEQELLGGREMS